MSFSCTYSVFPFLLFSYLVKHSRAAFIPSSSAPIVATPTALSVPPSQHWDGNDGPWSSFELRVGSPPQSVRVLVSTASNQPWVVLPEECTSCSPADCSEKRGGVFHTNESTTWIQNNLTSNGVFSLAINADLDLHGTGRYGYDTIGLGYHGSGTPVLDAQVVSGITTDSFYTGLFGLNPAATNFSSDEVPAPSYMSALKTHSYIPSLSYGYTAGNQYRSGKTPGSLTIGGFDASLFEPNELSIPFNLRDARELSIVIKSITVSSEGANRNLTTNSMYAVIDSSVPYIYLPKEVCQRFEEAFGITYDQSTQLYLVNDTLHQQLLQQSADIVFTLTSSTEDVMVDISLPYQAFDLIAEYPLVQNSTRYFPLKRATNSSQVTLGRTFLQEAYIIADYERSNFSIHQRKWDDNSNKNIQTILPPSSVLPSMEEIQMTQTNNAIPIAIAASIGSAILVTLLVGCTILIHQRRTNLKKSTSTPKPTSEKPTKPKIFIIHPNPLPPSPHTCAHSPAPPEPDSQLVSPITPATDCGPYCFQSLATQMHHTTPAPHEQTNLDILDPFHNPFHNPFPTNQPNLSSPHQIHELPTRTGSPVRELLGTPVEEEKAKLYGRAQEVERAMIRDGQRRRQEVLLREQGRRDLGKGSVSESGSGERRREAEVKGWI